MVRHNDWYDVCLHPDEMGMIGKGKSQTWLLVMDEKRKMADGRERKKAWAAASRKFPMLMVKQQW